MIQRWTYCESNDDSQWLEPRDGPRPPLDAELVLASEYDAAQARIHELESELWKCQQNRASNLQTIKCLETALQTIANDHVLDSDTQRLLRAHEVARAALGRSLPDRK